MKTQFSLTALVKKLRYGSRLRPARDWLTLLSFAAIAFIVGIAWGAVTFFNTVTEKTPIAPIQASATIINNQALRNVQKIFDTRAVEQEKYESGGYVFRDPSI
ncbi:MAG TPA: hypothetical protein ENJ75_02920 [Candidatus Kaiserbacteria bacterium]|nr:hypothetical protein [Candidatus Kaiserbacteria bacterium]